MITPLPKRVRTTVPVSPEVLEAFQQIAEATGMSVGRCMGEWLEDTLDAARFMGQTVQKARAAPKQVAQELHAYALGLGDMTSELLEEIRQKGRAADGRADAPAPHGRPTAGPRTTPPSNTGVNRPTRPTTKARK